jgi:hypothetical protein
LLEHLMRRRAFALGFASAVRFVSRAINGAAAGTMRAD